MVSSKAKPLKISHFVDYSSGYTVNDRLLFYYVRKLDDLEYDEADIAIIVMCIQEENSTNNGNCGPTIIPLNCDDLCI